MKNGIKNFIGVDISKSTLDLSLVIAGAVIFHKKINNTDLEIKRLFKALQKTEDITLDNTVVCMEHTGIYGNRLINYLSKEQMIMWLESGTHIKRSLGMVRGKNDQLDSKRIADFAFTHAHKLRPYTPPSRSIIQLKLLAGERNRYLKCKKQLTCCITEQQQFLSTELLAEAKKRTQKLVKQLDQQVLSVEEQILQIIAADVLLTRLYKILTSVDGIGMVTAIELIVTTEGFEKISDPKKYACYAGVVPFEHSSGSSIRGRNRVSQMANKKVKSTLHMAAISSIKMEGELRDYYLRKVEQGKNKMSIINAIRNKLLLRVFACVRDNRLYQKEHQISLVNP